MKYKNYGDNNEEFDNGLGVELLEASDPISARSINRPLANIYENQDEIYKLLNTLLKTTYGNTNNCIIPDVFEDFNPEGFIINSFKNDASKYYLRIPTGMMLLNKNKDSSIGKDNGNPFSNMGEYDYIDENNKENFSKDKNFSFVYDNIPNINLLERQLANFIALDLTDLTNDIKITQKELPLTYHIPILDSEKHLQKTEPDGNLSFVGDNNGNILSLSDEEHAEYYLLNYKNEDVSMVYDYQPQGKNDTVFENDYKTIVEKRYFYEEGESGEGLKKDLVTVKPGDGKDYICLTSKLEDAIKIKDFNGKEKTRLGYNMFVSRATTEDDEITYLPNKKENANWKLCMKEMGDPTQHDRSTEYTINIELFDEKDSLLRSWGFFFYDYATVTEINDMLFNKILVEGGGYLTVNKYQIKEKSRISNGVQISCVSEQSACDEYKLKISYKDNKGNKGICETLDVVSAKKAGWKSDKIDNVPPFRSQKQKYYYNIFELTNAFLGRFSSYQVSITNIYNYLSGESLIKINEKEKEIYIYYDLNFNTLNNKSNNLYDKSGRITSSYDGELDVKHDNFIKLFKIELDTSTGASLAPKIKSVTSYIKPLDRRLISTKRAELNSLLVNTRTDIKNYFNLKDEDGNRSIEITEDDITKDNEQTRLYSPISRISTTNGASNGIAPEWKDNLNGDTPSDFHDKYTTRNFIDNTTSDKYHSNEDIGFVIDKNKGILLYNNDIQNTNGKHNEYSSFKPIEILSKKGNINIITTDNDNSRIGIKNLNDSENNIIDNLGITRFRSKNDHQVVVRKIGPQNDNSNGASIAFVQGESTANSNINALSEKNESGEIKQEDIILGDISFSSGEDFPSLDEANANKNSTKENRKMSIKLSEVSDLNNYSTALEIRNAHSTTEGFITDKKIISMFGDLVPSTNTELLGNFHSFSLGLPYKSRTYDKKSKADIPYSDVDQLKADIHVDEEGSSTESINTEGRWLSLFSKFGYLGKLTLADISEDQENNDTRNGNLRMGNSNIYDISSIYINNDSSSGNSSRENLGTINFDNDYSKSSENTIYSYSNEEEESSISFVLNRILGNKPNNDTNIEKGNRGANVLKLTLGGSEFGKGLEVRRQLFVNTHKDATTEDNNILSVKGQSILNGELIVGKDNIFSDGTIHIEKYSSVNGYDQNNDIEHSNKKYNFEYVDDKIVKNDYTLYTFRNYGRTFLKGDVTIENGKFTDNTIFDKKVVISNNARNGRTFDEKNHYEDSKYYTNNKLSNDFVRDEDKKEGEKNAISRHHPVLDVENGTVLFGSDDIYDGNEDRDHSDLKLFGSQWIKRRLEIGTNKDTELFDTYMMPGRLIIDGIKLPESSEPLVVKESPSFYVKGASAFTGDVVFGGPLYNDSVVPVEGDVSRSFKYIKNHRTEYELEDGVIEEPIKAIFWGASFINRNDSKNEGLSISDFDFHGSTWFDNAVRIGCSDTDIGYKDSIDKDGRLIIKGKESDIFGDTAEEKAEWLNNKVTLLNKGTFAVQNSGDNLLETKWLGASSENGSSYSRLYLNGSSENNKSYSGQTFMESSNSTEIWSMDKNIKLSMNSYGTSLTNFESRKSISFINGDGDNESSRFEMKQDGNISTALITNRNEGANGTVSKLGFEDGCGEFSIDNKNKYIEIKDNAIKIGYVGREKVIDEATKKELQAEEKTEISISHDGALIKTPNKVDILGETNIYKANNSLYVKETGIELNGTTSITGNNTLNGTTSITGNNTIYGTTRIAESDKEDETNYMLLNDVGISISGNLTINAATDIYGKVQHFEDTTFKDCNVTADGGMFIGILGDMNNKHEIHASEAYIDTSDITTLSSSNGTIDILSSNKAEITYLDSTGIKCTGESNLENIKCSDIKCDGTIKGVDGTFNSLIVGDWSLEFWNA